jgi:hypothetical protein
MVRIGFLVTSSLIALVSVVYANPELAEDWGLDFWNYSHLNRELKQTTSEGEVLAANQEQTRWRLQYREDLMSDLLANRLTTEQVLVQFNELNRNIGISMESLHNLLGCSTDRQCSAKQVILYLDSRGHTDEHSGAIRHELEVILAQ